MHHLLGVTAKPTIDVEEQLSRIGRSTLTFRLKISGSIMVVGFLTFAGAQTFSLIQSYTDVIDAPAGANLAWLPISQIGPMLMLLGLTPSDRLGTLGAAVLLSILCAYYMTTLPLFTVLNGDTSDAISLSRMVVLVSCECFWGIMFFRQGPSRALLSLWRQDARLELNPRAALNGLWWTWRRMYRGARICGSSLAHHSLLTRALLHRGQ